jgi:DNA-binding CsgD family transcriptional regulator
MSERAVVVLHRERMVAEGVAAGLSAFRGITPIAARANGSDGEEWEDRADAVAIDPHLPGARRLATRLRTKGVRVVFMGPDAGDDEGIRVSTAEPIAALAHALAPGTERRASAADKLTSREREILRLVAAGLAGKQIAKRLEISLKTVEQYKTRIYAKLRVPNQAAAVSLLRTEA